MQRGVGIIGSLLTVLQIGNGLHFDLAGSQAWAGGVVSALRVCVEILPGTASCSSGPVVMATTLWCGISALAFGDHHWLSELKDPGFRVGWHHRHAFYWGGSADLGEKASRRHQLGAILADVSQAICSLFGFVVSFVLSLVYLCGTITVSS